MSKTPTVRAHISGLRGMRIEEWVIGAHVTKQAFEQFKDESTGELYVREVLEQGKPQQSLVPKKTWEDIKNIQMPHLIEKVHPAHSFNHLHRHREIFHAPCAAL